MIDDDAELCREMADVFKAEGYFIDCISSPDEIEDALRKTRYDAILIDFKIPHSNGVDLLRNVIKKSPQSKIFVTTGRPFIENLLEEEGLLTQVSGIFSKPFDIEIMLGKIRISTGTIPAP
jgi:DNA-binding response OmpR family regulator